MQTNRHIIVEGFEMVGKTTYAQKVVRGLTPRAVLYHADHDLTDKTIGRDNSWTIGYGIFDLLSHADLEETVVIDRHVASSYAYQKLYGGTPLSEEVIEYYKNNEFFHNSISHIHIQHLDRDNAFAIYQKSQSREKNCNELSNKYDQFESFDQYWERYLRAQEYFLEAYLKLKIVPTVKYTYDGGWKA